MTHLPDDEYFEKVMGLSYNPYTKRMFGVDYGLKPGHEPKPLTADIVAPSPDNTVPGYIQDIDKAKESESPPLFTPNPKRCFGDKDGEILKNLSLINNILGYTSGLHATAVLGSHDEFEFHVSCHRCGFMWVRETSPGLVTHLLKFLGDIPLEAFYKFLVDHVCDGKTQPIGAYDKFKSHLDEPPVGLQLDMEELKKDVEKYRPLLDKLKPND